MKRTLKPVMAGAVGTALLISTAACGGTKAAATNGDASSGPPPAAATIAWGDTIATLNPYESTQAAVSSLIGLIGGTLQQRGPDSTLLPGLATSETTSADGLTLTYKLRDNLVFSDGSPLTASDVAATFTYELNDKANARGGDVKALQSVAAPDPTTVVMTMKYPQPSFPNVLAGQPVFPASAFTDVTKFFAAPVSAGQYVLSSLASNGQQVVLKRNPKFYGSPAAIDTLTFSTVADVATRIVQVKAGTVDLAMTLSPSVLDQLDTPTTQGLAIKQFGLQWLWINDRTGPLSEVNVRKAISYALDRAQINKLAFAGRSAPVTSMWPTAMAENKLTGDVVPASVDIAKAKQLLTGTSCANGCTLQIQVQNAVSVDQSAALVIQQNLAAIGIKLDIVGVDKTTAGKNEKSGNFQLETHAFVVPVDIPDTYLTSCCLSTGGINAIFSGWQDQTVDDAVKATLSQSGQARTDALKTISNEFTQAVPYIPLVNYAAFVGESKKAMPWLTLNPGGLVVVKASS